MINERIDEFTFLSKIGEGGMATVYKAFDNNFADHVAIKVLKKEYVYNKNVRARFTSEARKLHQLSHQNIIRVRRILDAGDLVAFVMDLVSGKSLKDYVTSNKPMKDIEIKNFLNQILNALEFVHSKGFVHRDIKPSNFMITEDKNILLLDFGIAKDVNSTNSDYTATGTAHQMGTPSYMSPEQVKSTKAVDHRSDIYSLGVVLYYMVNGYGPYEGQNLSLFELYEKIVNEELKLTGSTFDNLIKLATNKDVAWRIQNCQNFRDNIETSGGEPFSENDTSGWDFWNILNVGKYFLFGLWLMARFGAHKDYGFIISAIGTFIIFYGFYLIIGPKSKD